MLEVEQRYDDDDLYVISANVESTEVAYWLVAEGCPHHCVGVFSQLEEALVFIEDRLSERKKSRAPVRVHYMLDKSSLSTCVDSRVVSIKSVDDFSSQCDCIDR